MFLVKCTLRARCTTMMLSAACCHIKVHLITRRDRRKWACIIKVKAATVIHPRTQQSAWRVGHILSTLVGSNVSFHPPPSPNPLFFLTRPPFAPQMFSFSPSDTDTQQQDVSVTSASSSFILAEALTCNRLSGRAARLHFGFDRFIP